jgi:formylglycine-generating enzyme required for sulfatase activity
VEPARPRRRPREARRRDRDRRSSGRHRHRRRLDRGRVARGGGRRRDRGARADRRRSPAAVPAGFVYVAAGSFQYGSAADEDTRRGFFVTAPLHTRHTGSFAIARTEVTIGDWLDYVDAQPEAARAALLPNVAPKIGGGIAIKHAPDGWRLTLEPIQHVYIAAWNEPLRYTGRNRRAVADWKRLPVLGITATDAAGYARWLDASGRVPGARLCNELEWERGARGADGRDYPVDHVLEPDDANIDITYDRDRMGPDEVGSHPASASPYGLLDMSGNAFEWTVADRGGYVLRGGSYYHDRKTADLANRNESAAELRDATAGMRLCATVR